VVAGRVFRDNQDISRIVLPLAHMVTAPSRDQTVFFSPASPLNDARSRQTQIPSATLRLFAYTDLNSVCYNSITEQGQMFWIAVARGWYGSQFDVLSMLSISPGI
jgi:hypothetical protein